MKVDLTKPRYAQTLKLVRHSLEMEPAFSSFWRRRGRWPVSDRRMIFLLDAIDCAGRAKFQESWTGKEFNAYRHVPEYDSFAQTIGDYRARMTQWAATQESGEHNLQELEPIVLTRSETAADVIEDVPEKSESQRRAEMVEAARLHVRSMETWGAKYRPQYNAALVQWADFTDANTSALNRLRWVIDWIADQSRDGAITTYLRRSSTEKRPGPYCAVPDGFWNVDVSINQWFANGDLEYCLADYDGPGLSAQKMERYYLFFDRKSFDRKLFSLSGETEASPSLTDIHLSPYMRLAIAVIREEGLTQSYQSKVVNVRDTINRLAPMFGIETENKQTLVRYIGTIVRDPESEKGRRAKSP